MSLQDEPSRFELIRARTFGPDAWGVVWEVKLYDTHTYDRRGQTGLAWEVYESGIRVACSENGADDERIYGSPLHADDSDETLMSAVQLICHTAGHDDCGDRQDAAWDWQGLENAATADYFGPGEGFAPIEYTPIE